MKVAIPVELSDEQRSDIHAKMSNGKYTSPVNNVYAKDYFAGVIADHLAEIQGAAEQVEQDKRSQPSE